MNSLPVELLCINLDDVFVHFGEFSSFELLESLTFLEENLGHCYDETHPLLDLGLVRVAVDLEVDGIGSLTNRQSVELIAALLMMAWTALLVFTSEELIVNSVLSTMLR